MINTSFAEKKETQNETEISVKRNFFTKATTTKKKRFIECNQFLFVNVWKRKSGALMDLLMESIKIHIASQCRKTITNAIAQNMYCAVAVCSFERGMPWYLITLVKI